MNKNMVMALSVDVANNVKFNKVEKGTMAAGAAIGVVGAVIGSKVIAAGGVLAGLSAFGKGFMRGYTQTMDKYKEQEEKPVVLAIEPVKATIVPESEVELVYGKYCISPDCEGCGRSYPPGYEMMPAWLKASAQYAE